MWLISCFYMQCLGLLDTLSSYVKLSPPHPWLIAPAHKLLTDPFFLLGCLILQWDVSVINAIHPQLTVLTSAFQNMRLHRCLPASRAHLDCTPSKSLEIGPIRFTNGQTSLGICLHNTIRTHVLNILSALKGRFHNKALDCTGEERLGWGKDSLQWPAGKTILGAGNLRNLSVY